MMRLVKVWRECYSARWAICTSEHSLMLLPAWDLVPHWTITILLIRVFWFQSVHRAQADIQKDYQLLIHYLGLLPWHTPHSIVEWIGFDCTQFFTTRIRPPVPRSSRSSRRPSGAGRICLAPLSVSVYLSECLCRHTATCGQNISRIECNTWTILTCFPAPWYAWFILRTVHWYNRVSRKSIRTLFEKNFNIISLFSY